MGWAISLRDEGDEGFVNAFEAKGALMEGMTKIVKVFYDDWPSSFKELIAEPIKARGFIIGEILYDAINLIGTERLL